MTRQALLRVQAIFRLWSYNGRGFMPVEKPHRLPAERNLPHR